MKKEIVTQGKIVHLQDCVGGWRSRACYRIILEIQIGKKDIPVNADYFK